MKKGKLFTVCFMTLAALVIAGVSTAADKGHGSMPGMSGEAKMEGHGMMKMGDKVFEGKVGSFHGEARLMDMRAQMEKAKASGMKMEGMMKNTHHLSVSLMDPGTKKHVTEGKGAVTVTGEDKKSVKTDFMMMQEHFGADIALDKPGKYEFAVDVESGGKRGAVTFSHTIK